MCRACAPYNGEKRQAKTAAAEERAARAARVAAQRRAPPQCCTECHARTEFVFALSNCWLCEACERSNPSKYGVVELKVACAMHALSERDLASLRSVVIDRKKPGGGSAGKTGGPRLFLRSDVEACAASRHQHQGEAAAHQRKAKADWKANSFKTDAQGKTHKWKAMNSPTYHMKQSAAKHRPVDLSDAAACVALSALRRVGFQSE